MTTIDAPRPDSRSVIRSTAATTAFVVGWYALPDYVPSKTTRTALKAVGLATFATLGVREAMKGDALREAKDLLRGTVARARGVDGEAGERHDDVTPTAPMTREATASHAAGVRNALDDEIATDDSASVAALAGAAVVVAGSTALTVVVEQRVFRRNERRAAEGVRRPHTGTGVLFGLLTALVAVPDILTARSTEARAS
ncbi:hypothetical protein Sked_15130 [Sanguibacter keddieii DSM 10542]|uniref:Peptidase S9 n=1 Tax=Sanguibacter keddieii (strain ATCC 51767 / DSM 10542 / NCFB 3025 / ST-74) TaxID=446469 RepID=D1BFT7_SANKS|nr:hypothetical protein [Sanguibacter keddieii]ACZ21448.1 hypothetical protein Sked_15130 [Sanguibacter keddieii DSM 10542]